MATPIPGFTPTLPPASASKASSVNTMTSGDFLKLMLTQLQQQDPLNPTDSNQLLSQMSQISTLQSNTTLTQNLQGLTLQQSIGAAGNLIGKVVQGIDAGGNGQTGIVTSVKIENQNVLLELDNGHQLPMANLTNIAMAPVGSSASQ